VPSDPHCSEIASRSQCFRAPRWSLETVPAAELVRGDLVKLSLGGVVAADMHLLDGSYWSISRCSQANRSPSKPEQVGYLCGFPVRRGEATAVVTPRGCAPNSGVQRNWSAPRTLSVPNRKPCCGLCAISPFSMAASSSSSNLRLVSCDAVERNHPVLLTSVLAAIPVRCPRPLRWRRRWVLVLLLR